VKAEWQECLMTQEFPRMFGHKQSCMFECEPPKFTSNTGIVVGVVVAVFIVSLLALYFYFKGRKAEEANISKDHLSKATVPNRDSEGGQGCEKNDDSISESSTVVIDDRKDCLVK
jgi:hypothetical protein